MTKEILQDSITLEKPVNALGLRKSTISKVVKQLAAKGYAKIERQRGNKCIRVPKHTASVNRARAFIV